MTVTQFKRDPDPEIVEKLEELLAEAKSGNLVEFVAVGNLVGDGAFIRSSTFSDRWRMLGAIEYAKATVEKG